MGEEKAISAKAAERLVVVASLAILGGSISAVVAWIGALPNTWQLEDKLWFASRLALGCLALASSR